MAIFRHARFNLPEIEQGIFERVSGKNRGGSGNPVGALSCFWELAPLQPALSLRRLISSTWLVASKFCTLQKTLLLPLAAEGTAGRLPLEGSPRQLVRSTIIFSIATNVSRASTNFFAASACFRPVNSIKTAAHLPKLIVCRKRSLASRHGIWKGIP